MNKLPSGTLPQKKTNERKATVLITRETLDLCTLQKLQAMRIAEVLQAELEVATSIVMALGKNQ